jgi:glycosyltransferase involved in cell wall biosynthesis
MNTNRKKILFLTHYFPPEVNAPANRTFEHCKEWAKEIDVTVITNFPNHPDGKIFNGYRNKLIQKENIEGINVIRLWTFITPNEGFLLRTLNYIIYMIEAVLYATFSKIKFDAVIATTPQFFCGMAGKYISVLRRKPLILELRDIWPESIVAVGALTNKWIINFLEKMELGLYRKSKKIVSVTKSFKENLVSRGISAEKIDVIYNGVSLAQFNNPTNISDKELAEYLSSGFKVGYIGTIGMAHSLATLVEAAYLLKNTDVKFVIVGSGAERLKIEKEIEDRKLKNIRVFPLQPKSEIPSIINSLDLFCVHLKKNDLFKTVIPSKIFEGMILKKPILMGVDGESREIILEANCGLPFEPENPDELKNVILRYQNDKNLMALHGQNGFDYVQKNFNRIEIAKKYLGIILNVVGGWGSFLGGVKRVSSEK